MNEEGQRASAGRLFGPDGRTVIVAMDHALGAGQVPPLDDPRPTLERVLQGRPDGLILTEGMRRLLPGARRPPWILTADYYATSVIPGAAGNDEIHRFIWSPNDASERGAAGLKCLLVFGRLDPEEQARNVASVAQAVSLAQQVGMPVMVETTLWGRRIRGEQQHDASLVAHAARVAFELGADIIKIPIPDDMRTLERLTAALPVPIVLMGGPSVDAEHLFHTLRDALDAGARGVALGRNVWESDDPAALVKVLRLLVHDGVLPSQALESLRVRRLDTP